MTYDELHRVNCRVIPAKMSNYNHAVLLCAVYNNYEPLLDWPDLNLKFPKFSAQTSNWVKMLQATR
jgi:hypothetical protein